MKLGRLDFERVEENLDMVAVVTKNYLEQNKTKTVLVATIDPGLADTQAFCEKYSIGLDVSVNCVIVEAKRAERVWYAAILIPATSRADINGIVRRELDARKISFAPMEKAVGLTKMEYGGITPLGLPEEWPVLIDESVTKLPQIIIGSGLRKSKLLVSGQTLANLKNAKVLKLTKDK